MVNSSFMQTKECHLTLPILYTQNLSIGYKTKEGVLILEENLHIKIHNGELVCLIGPNGFGKSTLMRTIAGLQRPLEGNTFISDINLRKLRPHKYARLLSLVLTDKINSGALTVHDIVSIGRYLYINYFARLSAMDNSIIDEALAKVNLIDYTHQFFSELSDGEKQRVLIAKALAQDTPLIMLDEPTAHLDLPNRVEIMNILKHLAKETNKAILLSTHELDLALQTADTIWLMNRQDAIISGTPEDLVLTGSFENVFRGNAFEFDKYTGAFKVVHPCKGEYNIILVNGIPAGTENISTIDLTNVSQVEVMKGPFSSLYGSGAMGGVINIVQPRSKGPISGKANLAYGSFNTSKASVNLGGDIDEGFNFNINANSESQGEDYKIGYNNLLKLDETEKAIIGNSTYGERFPNTTYNQLGGNLRLGYDVGKIKMDLYSGIYSAKNIFMNGSFYNVYGSDKKDLTRYTNSFVVEAGLGANHIKFSPYYHTDLSEYYSDLTDETYIESNAEFDNYGFQLQDRLAFGDHHVVAGIDHDVKEYSSQRWSDEVIEITPYNPDYEHSTSGLLFQGQFKFFENRLHFSVGGRYDMMKFSILENDLIGNESATERHHVFNPNVGVKANVTKMINIHSSWGTAFHAPTAYQKAGSYSGTSTYIGNPDLKPEESSTIDVGVGFNNYLIGLDVDLTFFNTEYDQMFIKTPVEGEKKTYTYTNANSANMQGLEFMFAYNLGALYDYKFSLKAYANFTFMLHTKQKTEGSDAEEDILYVRKQNGNFGIEFKSNKWSSRINARYIGTRIENNWFTYYPNVRPDLPALAQETQPEYGEKSLIKHPKHIVFDANVYYNINKAITFGGSIGNILDENYTEKDGYNMPGRNFLAKVILSF